MLERYYKVWIIATYHQLVKAEDGDAHSPIHDGAVTGPAPDVSTNGRAKAANVSSIVDPILYYIVRLSTALGKSGSVCIIFGWLGFATIIYW